MFFAEEVGVRISGCVIVSAATFKVMLVLLLVLLLVLNCYALVQVKWVLRSLKNVLILIEFGIIERELGCL